VNYHAGSGPNDRYIGAAVARREDSDLLTGRAETVADLAMPGLLELAFARSPLAHARVNRADAGPARPVPGVTGAWSAADLPGLPAVPVPPGSRETFAGLERPALAAELRADPSGIPNFVEECLRLEGPIKSTFRLALEDTKIGDVDVPAGTIVMGSIGAANRDPRVFDDPDTFDPKRRNARRHIAFGHGEHFCPGASLARAEARVSLERLLARLDDVQLLDPTSLHYAETFIIRGLESLPLRFRRRD